MEIRKVTFKGLLAPSLFLAALCSTGRAPAEEKGIVRPDRHEIRAQLRRGHRFAGPRASAPDAFQLQYALPEPADLSVTLLDLRRVPLRTFHVSAGQPGAQAGENTLTVWEGRDSQGEEAPAGEYWAALSFRYTDGRVENKRFRVLKP